MIACKIEENAQKPGFPPFFELLSAKESLVSTRLVQSQYNFKTCSSTRVSHKQNSASCLWSRDESHQTHLAVNPDHERGERVRGRERRTKRNEWIEGGGGGSYHLQLQFNLILFVQRSQVVKKGCILSGTSLELQRRTVATKMASQVN